MPQWEQIDQGAKQLADVTAIGIAVGTLMGWLPSIAAILTIVWTAVRIYETETVQRLLGKKRID